MRSKTAVKAKVGSGTQSALIVSQIIVAAAVAVPLGLFAAAAGILTARSQSGQVRVAFYTNTSVTASPSPSPSPSPLLATLPAPANFNVTSVGINHIGLAWDSVAGASGYAVYNFGNRMAVFEPNPSYIEGYWINNLAAGAMYQLQVATLAADGKESKKSDTKTVQTTPAVPPTCEKTWNASKSQERIIKACNATANFQVCQESQVFAQNEANKFTCESPCKRYMKPKPPLAHTPTCVDLPQETIDDAANDYVPPRDLTGYKILGCNATAELWCKKDPPPAGDSGWVAY